jgi:hypothetical protein
MEVKSEWRSDVAKAVSDEKVITDPAPFSGLRRHTRLCQPD